MPGCGTGVELGAGEAGRLGVVAWPSESPVRVLFPLTTPHFPLDLLGLEKELPQPSSIYCQESAYWSDQDEHAKPEETTCTQVEDSLTGSP